MRMKKICEECKKVIKGGSVTMMSVEPEDFGIEFYVCLPCAKENYGTEGKQAVI